MAEPEALLLAQRIAPLLEGLAWAIGGSVLLHHLGIEPAPNDLDIVVTEAHFTACITRLQRVTGAGRRPSGKGLCSTHFQRFDAGPGPAVDVMAGIAARTATGLVRWHFDASRVRHEDGLPWMLAEDWLVLYRLFDRPARVAQVASYLASTHCQR